MTRTNPDPPRQSARQPRDGGRQSTRPDPPFEVSGDAEPAGRCPYCDRPFAGERALALHVGETHETRCTAREREAYEDAMADERDELFLYHMKVVVALSVVYGVVVLAYMIALGSGLL